MYALFWRDHRSFQTPDSLRQLACPIFRFAYLETSIGIVRTGNGRFPALVTASYSGYSPLFWPIVLAARFWVPRQTAGSEKHLMNFKQLTVIGFYRQECRNQSTHERNSRHQVAFCGVHAAERPWKVS